MFHKGLGFLWSLPFSFMNFASVILISKVAYVYVAKKGGFGTSWVHRGIYIYVCVCVCITL